MPLFHFFKRNIAFIPSCYLLLLVACGNPPATVPISTPDISTVDIQPQPPTAEPTQTPYIITATQEISIMAPSPQGSFFLSIAENGYYHLFVYSPQTLPLTRLTSDAWDDIAPALSPDGNRVAFSSRRNGYWDLYLLDLVGAGVLRLTDTLEYDSYPSWSPDGAYIVYESYRNGNLDLFIRSVTDLTQSPIQLTLDPATDTSPTWSPLGRQIAFVSDRSGKPEIWIADLDNAGNFINLSDNPEIVISHPAWSPDGSKLAWAGMDSESGLSSLYIWDAGDPTSPPRWAGSGDWPVWQDNDTLSTRLTAPNQTFLVAYSTNGSISLPPILLPGSMSGFTFGHPATVLSDSFQIAAQITPAPLYDNKSDPQPDIPSNRFSLVELTNNTATYPQLSELAFDSFQALRTQVANRTGWDALGNLENAFVPLSTPMEPGLGDDWLYTGRAITLNPALVQAKWMVVEREDFGRQIYWRIYLHTSSQDGSQGTPLTQAPWDFSARSSNSSAYENGGKLMDTIPTGYWLDLTALAAQYGWERLPALTNWRSYYSGARLNELAFLQGLDWQTAMLQLYPPEILVTPTLVIPPTRTPTRTPLWYRSPTPTSTSTIFPANTP